MFLLLGIFVCKKGIADPACKSNEPAPNITTTVTFHRRQATVFASYLNLTITDVTDMTPTKPAPIEDLEAYLSVLDWILDYNKANVPAPSSIVQSFWSGYEQLDAGFDAVLLPTFHGLLAFPVFFFNANHYGNANLQTETISPDLPPEFYTTASIVAPYVKLKFDHVFLGLFIALQGIALIFLWVVVVWGFAVSRHLPDISSFPGFDVMFKTQPWNLRALEEEGDLWEKGDSEILRLMRDVRATSRKF
jgi:hypothetical protein